MTDWYEKNKFKKYQLLLIATNFIIKIKQVNLGTLLT